MGVKLKLLFSVIGIYLASIQPATSSETIGSFILHPNRKVALMTGEITPSTQEDFDILLAQAPSLSILYLNSSGGTVVAALNIANKVHALGINTIVPSGALCASACSTIFFAGNSRQAEGRLGVHQMSYRGTPDLRVVQNLISSTLDLYEKVGVDREITRYMLTTPADSMYYFSEEEIDAYTINRNNNFNTSGITKNLSLNYKFADYIVKDNFKGKIVLPNFKTDKGSNVYRTRIRKGMANGPNFSGHYNLIEIGCGSSCRFGILIDANTGLRYDFPLGGEENYQLNLTMTVESRLLRATWKDVYNDDSCVKQHYEMVDNVGLKLLNEIRYKVPEFSYCE